MSAYRRVLVFGVLVLGSFLATLLIACSSGGGVPSRPESLGRETVNFRFPKPDRWTLSNGLVVYYKQDLEQPLIQGTMYFYGGGLLDPPEKLGLAQATGSQLRAGGIQGMSPEAFDDALDAVGATIEASFGSEYGSVAFSSLEEDLPQVLSWFRSVIREPAFNPSRFEIWKKLKVDSILQRKDNPETIALFTLYRAVYGPENAYSRAPSLSSVNSITRADLIKFYELYVRPQKAVLALSGPASREKIADLIERNFAHWTKPDQDLPPIPKMPPRTPAAVYVVQKDIDQARVFIGHQGVGRNSPDDVPITVFERAFGYGAHGSMLFIEIRSRLGLAYAVGAQFDQVAQGGIFYVHAGTRNEKALDTMRKLEELLHQVRVELMPEQMFNEARFALRNSYVFQFESTRALTQRAALYDFLGFPESYDQMMFERIPLVSREEVKEMANRLILPEELSVVIVGNFTPEQVASAVGKGRTTYRVEFGTEPLVLGPVVVQ